DRGHAMHRSGREVESRARADDLVVQHPLAGRAELEPRAALEHVPGLILFVVELEAERLSRADEEDLAGVVVGLRPDQLMTPRLVHLLGLRRELVEPAEVR